MRWSPEKVPGVPMRLLHSASAALVVSFAESSRSAAAAVIRSWLCPPLPGFPGGREACRQHWSHDGVYVPYRDLSSYYMAVVTPHHPPVFPQMGLGPMRLGSIPIPLTVPSARGPHPGGGSGPRGTVCTPLQDLINQVA